ncbi:MAG TPA: hypothetical protein VIM83_05120 [Candidatus Limnocylindria bacterium]
MLAAVLMITCGQTVHSPGPTSSDPSAGSLSSKSATPVPTEGPLMLHAVSWSRNETPHEQILFEGGGDPSAFSELRLLGPDGAPIASGSPVLSALEVMRICPGSKTNEPAPVYGALRVTVSLASQQQLGDVIGHPERYRVEVLARGTWQAVPFIFECHAQE